MPGDLLLPHWPQIDIYWNLSIQTFLSQFLTFLWYFSFNFQHTWIFKIFKIDEPTLEKEIKTFFHHYYSRSLGHLDIFINIEMREMRRRKNIFLEISTQLCFFTIAILLLFKQILLLIKLINVIISTLFENEIFFNLRVNRTTNDDRLKKILWMNLWMEKESTALFTSTFSLSRISVGGNFYSKFSLSSFCWCFCYKFSNKLILINIMINSLKCS